MISSRRQLLLLGALAVRSGLAQDSKAPRRVILDASRALQGSNAPRFIGYFDKTQYKQLAVLRQTVTALLATRSVGSSVDILTLVEHDSGWKAEIDWLLQLTPIQGAGPIETRQESVTVELRQNAKGQWRMTSFDPIDLFRVL